MDETIQEPSYYVNFREFKTGLIEATLKLIRPMQMDAARDRFENFNPVGWKTKQTDEELLAEQQANWSRAVRRAKQNIRWLCKQMGADRLLTLTYRENIQDREKVKADFKRFLRFLRLRYPQWKYVAVLELQDRGAFHIHCAVQGWQRISYIRECWYRALGGHGDETGANTPGQVDVTSPNRRWGTTGITWKTERLASYITKYLDKTFDQMSAEKRRYWSARDIKVPDKCRHWLGSQNIIDAIKLTVTVSQVMYGLQSDFDMWLSPDQSTFFLSGRTSP